MAYHNQENVPEIKKYIDLVADFSHNLYDPNPDSKGVAFCCSGGGAYACISTVSIYNGLYYGNVLNDKYIKYLSTCSGGGWANGLVSFISSTQQLDNSLESKLGPEYNPENLKLEDFFTSIPSTQADYGFDESFFKTIFQMTYHAIWNYSKFQSNMLLERIISYYALRNQKEYSYVNIIAKDTEHLNTIINRNYSLSRNLDSTYILRPGFPYPITAFTTYYYQNDYEINIPLEINPNYVSFLGTGHIQIDQEDKMFKGGISTYAFNSEYISSVNDVIITKQNYKNNIFGINDFIGGTSNVSKDIISRNNFLIPKMYIPFHNSANNIETHLSLVADGAYTNDSGLLAMLARKSKIAYCVINDGRISKSLDYQHLAQGLVKCFDKINGVFPADDLSPTIKEIESSRTGIVFKKYKVNRNQRYGLIWDDYEVDICWIYINSDMFDKLTPLPVRILLHILKEARSYPHYFIKKIINYPLLIDLSPVELNSIRFLYSWIAKKFISPLIIETVSLSENDDKISILKLKLQSLENNILNDIDTIKDNNELQLFIDIMNTYSIDERISHYSAIINNDSRKKNSFIKNFLLKDNISDSLREACQHLLNSV